MDSIGTLAGCSLIIAVVLGVTAVIARFSAFYRRELAETGQRELPLDGLRGVAALMVTVHHAAVCRVWLQTGEWREAGTWLPQLAGPVGVILFFLLTGYLFWSKARAAAGWMNPLKLWRGRFLRIAPLYLFSVALILAVATVFQGTDWLTWSNVSALLRLLAMGTCDWHAIGEVYPGEYNANVIWTLQYEWCFYLLLPFIAWLAGRGRLMGISVTAYAIVFAALWLDLVAPVAVYFLGGMFAAELLAVEAIRRQLKASAAFFIALALGIFIVWSAWDALPQTGPSDLLVLACLPVFLTIAAGNTVLGILTRPVIRCLGSISFSLYLLHGIAFTIIGLTLKKLGMAHVSAAGYWLMFVSATVALTGLCALTYRWIESPFLFRRKNAAVRIMDELEGRGIVGPSQGAEPREILIDLDGQGGDGNGQSLV